MSQKLRIAQITNCWESVPPQNKGGLEQMVFYLCEGLSKLGHEVTLFGTADSNISGKVVPIWPKAVSHDPYGRYLNTTNYTMWSVSEAFHHASEFDIIHNHTSWVSGHFLGLINKPVVTTLHHPVGNPNDFLSQFPPEYKSYFDRIEHQHFSEGYVVSVSNNQGKYVSDLYRVIHNGIPQSEWLDNTSNSGSYLAYLGYISGNKGVAEAIQAVMPTTEKLKIAGAVMEHDLDSVRYFKEQVEPFIDADKIEYLGPINQADKKEFLKNAKAVLMPIQWEEPFGLVAIEALACGTPVIANNRGALPEIIENGINGFLVNSVEEMTTKIAEVDKIDRRNCRKRFEENFTAERMVANYEKLYSDIIRDYSLRK